MKKNAASGAIFDFTIFSLQKPKDIKEMHFQQKNPEVLLKIEVTTDIFVFFRFCNFSTNLKLQMVVKTEPMDI